VTVINAVQYMSVMAVLTQRAVFQD